MKQKGGSGIEKRMVRQYLVLVLPGMIIFTVGLIIPLFLSFRYSLTDWDGMTAEKTFVGLQNSEKNFDYPEKPLKYKHIRRISD